MAVKYQAYPEYKDSGVEWLGNVPSHWNARQLKFLCTHNDEVLADSTSGDYEIEYVDIGSVSATEGISKTESMTLSNAPSRAKRIVRDGDVIVSTVRTYLEAIAPIDSPPDNLIVSTGFAVIRPNKFLHKGFAAYCLRASGFIKEVVAQSVGVSYPAINATDLVNIKAPEPIYEEQEKIANFLDRETAKIDTLIEKQQQLIKLLKEKRQAVISHVVTKGLNPDAPMRDSCIEWLGQVPEHWEISSLGFECSVKARLGWKGLKAEEYVDEGYIFLATPNIKGEKIDFENVNYITKARYDESPEIMLNEGDVLVTKDGSTTGTTNIVRELPSPATVNSSIAVLRSVGRIDSSYLYYFFVSTYVQNVIKRIQGGMGVPHLFQADLRKFNVLMPPFKEQKEIAADIDMRLPKFDDLIAKAEYSILLMKERRTALISAAITGKIDVRKLQ